MTEESVDVRLARVEEKLDALTELVRSYLDYKEKTDDRLRIAEQKLAIADQKFKVILAIGAGAWAVLLLLLGRVFARWI